MHITDLPEEILIMIVRELDLQSLECLYNTCSRIRNIVSMHGVIRQCNISLSVMATANTLKLNFFKDISGHLQELNLAGVPDLYKTSLLPAMRKLKSLIALDVSYTNLTVIDLLDIFQACPTLKCVGINFVFGKPGLVRIPMNILLQCQLVFENFEKVHFVGSLNNLIYSKIGLFILERARLRTLKYSIAECDYVCTTDENIHCDKLPQFNQFVIYLLNWKEINKYHGCMNTLPVLSMLEWRHCEFIIIIIMLELGRYMVYVSPLFNSFFKENFNQDVECITEFDKGLLGNVAMMLWNKEATNFDDNFFREVKSHIKEYFPFFCYSNFDNPAPKNYDWFYIVPTAPDIVKNEESHKYEPEVRKRRIVAPNVVLNYDKMFKEKYKVQLSLVFNGSITSAVTLSTNCDYLRKLTFLSLMGSVRYSSEFFNVLFRCCNNLITLNVDAPPISPCAASISRSIPLTHSLRNIRLVDKRIDFSTLFSSFSQCHTLENIHILESGQSELCDISDPSIILEKCKNLYSLYIEAPMTDTAHIKKMQMLNKAKVRCNKYNLNVVLHAKSANNRCRYNYDPFVDVFNLNPIKPV